MEGRGDVVLVIRVDIRGLEGKLRSLLNRSTRRYRLPF